MSREKQIEEMAEIIHKADENCAFAFPNSLIESLNKHGRYRVNEAIELYNAGYRKQSEFAREIFAEIESCLDYIEEQLDDIPDSFTCVKEDIVELKKKYIEEKTNANE